MLLLSLCVFADSRCFVCAVCYYTLRVLCTSFLFHHITRQTLCCHVCCLPLFLLPVWSYACWTCCMCFVGKAFVVFALMEDTAFYVCCWNKDFFAVATVAVKQFLPSTSLISFISFRSSLVYLLAVVSNWSFLYWHLLWYAFSQWRFFCRR